MDPFQVLGVVLELMPLASSRATAPQVEIEWRRIAQDGGARLSCLVFNGRRPSFWISRAGLKRQVINQMVVDGRIVPYDLPQHDEAPWRRYPIQDEVRNRVLPSNLTYNTSVPPGIIPREVVLVDYRPAPPAALDLGSSSLINEGVYVAELRLLLDGVGYQTRARFAVIHKTPQGLWFMDYLPLQRWNVPTGSAAR